ncbi:DgyrCDS14939 [Dimorphilus gyrociliatus]|nr:DgyrCDS14939 [Dimorphilus gyrociliatus]
MTKRYEDLLKDYAEKGDEYFENGVNGMEFYHFCPILLNVKIRSMVFRDLSLAVGSMLFIVVFMLIQTQSFWITFLAVYSIFSSFLITNLIYYGVLRFTYFGVFHILDIFIILGIGADNVFVLYDTWRETSYHKYPTIAHRLSHCYRKASIAMFYTTLTTAIAFIVSAASPFMTVYTFGVFSAILVIVNYLSVIIFLPCVVFTYATFWDKFKCCCCCKKNPKDKDNSNDIKKKNIIVRFFSGPYFKLITNRIARWFILAFFAGLFAAFVYFASTLKVNQEETKFLKDSSNYGRYLADASTKYKGNPDNIIKIYLVFGLKPQDRSDCYHTDFKCTGKQHWDNDFNLSSNKTQQKFLEFCQLLHNLKEENTKDLYIKRDKSTNVPEVLCFMKNMIEFYKNDALNLTYKHSIPFDVRTSHDIFANDNSGLYKDIGKLKGEAVNKHFELAMDWWLFNGTNPPPGTSPPRRSTDFALFNELLGEEKLKGSVTYKKHLETIVYGTKLKYAAIIVNTTIERNRIGYTKGLEIRDKWEDFINKQSENLPNELNGVWQTAIENVERVDSGKSIWHWLAVQRILVGSAITGIAIGVGLSCPILIVATHNIFVGILATITIACVTVCVIGVLPIAGWKLGLMESLNSVLVVGLAVDYIVHLAEGYSRSVYKSREERVKDMLTQVGVSVLSGASTTLGASFFLLLGDLLFFVEFGAFMFATIGFSIVWALGFFSTILGMFGPQNNFGSLKPVYSWIISRCNRQQSSNQ